MSAIPIPPSIVPASAPAQMPFYRRPPSDVNAQPGNPPLPSSGLVPVAPTGPTPTVSVTPLSVPANAPVTLTFTATVNFFTPMDVAMVGSQINTPGSIPNRAMPTQFVSRTQVIAHAPNSALVVAGAWNVAVQGNYGMSNWLVVTAT